MNIYFELIFILNSYLFSMLIYSKRIFISIQHSLKINIYSQFIANEALKKLK